MLVDTERADDLDDCMARMIGARRRYRYSVAWIDCLARGRHLGGPCSTRGDHARLDDLPAGDGAGALDLRPRRPPAGARSPPPSGLLNPLTVAAFNEAWYRKAPRRRVGHLETIAGFFHPLDGVEGWNRLYGPRGFLQYQCVVPDRRRGRRIRAVVERVSGPGRLVPGRAEALRPRRPRSAVVPHGRVDAGPRPAGRAAALSVPCSTISTTWWLEAGGRVYLAKDARLRPELLEAMYPGLERVAGRAAAGRPRGRLVSDLARRLGVTAMPGARRPPTRKRSPMNDGTGMPQTAVVIGGPPTSAGSILRALVARRLRRIVLAGRDEMALQAVADELLGIGATSVETVFCDVTDAGRPRVAGPDMAARLGQIDLVLVAAGVLGRPGRSTRSIPGRRPASSTPTSPVRPPPWWPSPRSSRPGPRPDGGAVVGGRASGCGGPTSSTAPPRPVSTPSPAAWPSPAGYGAPSVMVVRPGLGGHPHDRRAAPGPMATTADAVAADVVTGLGTGRGRGLVAGPAAAGSSPSCGCCPGPSGGACRAERRRSRAARPASGPPGH